MFEAWGERIRAQHPVWPAYDGSMKEQRHQELLQQWRVVPPRAHVRPLHPWILQVLATRFALLAEWIQERWS